MISASADSGKVINVDMDCAHRISVTGIKFAFGYFTYPTTNIIESIEQFMGRKCLVGHQGESIGCDKYSDLLAVDLAGKDMAIGAYALAIVQNESVVICHD